MEDTNENGNPTGPRKPFLVVGLGNPGLEYLWTPHNAGFMAIDRIAEQEGVVVQNRRCRAVTATCRIAGRETILAKPETFMNLSGLSLAALIQEFEVDPARDLLERHAIPANNCSMRAATAICGRRVTTVI